MHYKRTCVRGGYSHFLSVQHFVVEVSGSHFLFLNLVFVLVWLTCLVSVTGIPLPCHSGASVYVW